MLILNSKSVVLRRGFRPKIFDERISSHETPISRAVLQLKQVCRHLQQRPITLWDSEYGCAPFVKETANINADQLIRLRPNRCIYAEPPQYQGNGRPKKHGEKMKLSDPETWAVPVESIEIDDHFFRLINCLIRN